ncbi:MAG: hypothetical protein OEV92_02870 [Nitrospinota bacterium]|nr:hypothetical protein [Nitrospinota bacterium]
MSEKFGKPISGDSVRELSGGFFSFIAKALLISTFALMTLLWGLFVIVEYQEKFESRISTPGRVILRIQATGIYKLVVEKGTGSDCLLFSMGKKPASLFAPGQAWYGALSGASTAYLSHIEAPGVYNLVCGGEGEPSSMLYTKAALEGMLWLFAWMVALPVGLMGGFLLLGWLYVGWAAPKGDYAAYPTTDESLLARMSQEDSRKK